MVGYILRLKTSDPFPALSLSAVIESLSDRRELIPAARPH